MAKFEARMKAAQDNIAAAVASKRERHESFVIKGIADEGEKKLAECRDLLEKASDAEAVLKELAESGTPAQTADKITVVEKAIQAAQSKMADAKTFVSMKKLSVRSLSESGSKALTDSLANFQTQVDEVVEHISKLRCSCVEIKKAALHKKAAK